MQYSKIVFDGFVPQVRLQKQSEGGQILIFDPFRKRWLTLTPEEWVRQNVLSYLVDGRGYPFSLIATEVTIEVNGRSKRCDAVVYDKDARPLLIVEFKAQNVVLSQEVFDQIAVYNMALNVPYLFVSNGVEHVFCKVDRLDRRLLYCDGVPMYGDL